MPIVTQCPQCGKRLKAPDDRVGRQAKCPNCKNGFTIEPVVEGAPAIDTKAPEKRAPEAKVATSGPAPIVSAPTAPAPTTRAPAAPAPTASSPPAPGQSAATQGMWHVQTADGAHYGPVTKADLDAWVADERLDAECQVLLDGWDQWKWAEEVYPQLAPAGGQSHGTFDVAATAPGGVPIVADDRNPYAAPVTQENSESYHSGSRLDSPRLTRSLQMTRPWVLLFAVLSFIVTGLATLNLLFSVLSLFISPLSGILSILIAGIYVGIYLYIGLLLLKYASACGKFTRTRAVADLEIALEAQATFWKFAGIMVLVAIGLTALIVLIMIFALGGLALFSGRH